MSTSVTDANKAPRVLTMTFELRVPTGLRANIRAARVTAAIDGIKAAVVATAPIVFPWADRIDVRSSWAYLWDERAKDTVSLPATDENTI